MKIRKFAEEGLVDAEDSPARKEAIARALARANDPDAMGEGNAKYNLDEFTAYKEEAPSKDPYRYFEKIPLESKAKPKVVTAEQLQAFKKQYGADKDLTDYMNAQQGLTRRKAATPAPSKASAPSKAATQVESNLPAMSEEARVAAMGRIPTGGNKAAPTPGNGRSVTGSDLSRNVSNTLNATAGLKGVQMGQLAAEAAMGTRAGKALSGLMSGKKAAEVERIGPPLSAAERAEFARLFPKGERRRGPNEMKKGGAVKKYASGGGVKGYGQARGARPAKIC